METNLQQNRTRIIPGGIFSGIEAFWYENEKWVFASGTAFRFKDASPKVQQAIRDAFMDDKQSINYLKKIGITKFSEAFERWYKCVVGGLDSTPDISNSNRFTADAYNNMCSDTHCPDRGLFCSRTVGLRNYEVQTILALRRGQSLQNTASDLCISFPGLKSRVEKIKIKLNAKNMAELISKTAEIGILNT